MLNELNALHASPFLFSLHHFLNLLYNSGHFSDRRFHALVPFSLNLRIYRQLLGFFSIVLFYLIATYNLEKNSRKTGSGLSEEYLLKKLREWYETGTTANNQTALWISYRQRQKLSLHIQVMCITSL